MDKKIKSYWIITNILLFLINQMGYEKIALGSDFPFPLGEKKPGQLIQNLNV